MSCGGLRARSFKDQDFQYFGLLPPLIFTITRPVGLALYGCSNRKSGVTPGADPSRTDALTRGVVST
eukprot:6174039-Pleurochrysis_carterae.AAC.1